MHRLIHIVRFVLCFAVAAGLGSGAASGQTKLLRFPDIHRDKVVFTYAGDLWTASSSGGTATRLTAHPGLELFAKFSPDGKWIAFTGQYDGDEQVYVIPATGGIPKQLTFYPARGPFPPRWGYDNQVYGWTPDGKSVFFRSLRDGWAHSQSRIYTVPVDGGLGEPLPMPWSGGADLSPDGKQVVYTPFARDFRTWKRYQGGWAQDLWTFDLATHAAKKITDTPRTERDPMWIGNKIYFDSDRTGTLNLYSYDLASGATTQLTKSTQWDVRWPSADEEGQIVYEMNGELNVFDTRTGQARHLAIDVPGDGLDTRPSQLAAADQIEDAALSPKGERALFTARGDIFNTPIEKGVTRNLTRSSGAHDKGARWSPDGRKVAYISDGSGEEEVYVVDALGVGKPEQLTTGGKAQRFAPEWAPDGKRLAFSDKDGRLWVVTLAGKKLVEVAHDVRNQIRDYAWSPCGGHLAFSMTNANTFRSVWIWSVEDGKLRQITDEQFHASNPAWDPKGEYLYYLSARSFLPQFDTFDLNFAEDRNFGIFALALRKDVANPFSPEEDTVTLAEEKKGGEETQSEKKDKKEKTKAKEPGFTRIDFDGLASRVARVPLPFDDYGSLSAAEGRLLFVKQPPNTFGEPPFKPSLQIFTVKDRKTVTLAESVDGYALSPDGNKVLAVQDGKFNVYDATAAGKDSKKTIDTGGMVVDRVPAEEWAEVFREAWRRYRDYFYVPTMNGYDWEALRRQYEPLLAYAGHRSDVNYIIGEMIAELNNSHAYVAGGDYKAPARPRVALPGARFELDRQAGRYRIARIFSGQNEEDLYRSPLTEIGVNVHAGDYVLAIDGEDLAAKDNPYRLLRHKADRPVRMTVNAKPTLDGAREVTFRPIDTEEHLIYLDWVNGNREKVAKMSGGRIGYIHMPDMGEDGMREFVKWYFGQIRKEGLIVDVRDNGGGFISPTLLERLARHPLGVDYGRNNADPQPYPQVVFYGHMACLLNEGSGSDGDIFPYMFRQLGLGPLIGTRTWGGVVGISGHGPMIDGGQIFVPEAGSVSLEGKWIIEGHGVDPDIVVENDIKSVLGGHDPQLERGVAEVMKKIVSDPKAFPKRPEPPVRTQGQ
ncbi:MAG TPA: S41 family peptidase [Thermoanaerobaculia bacterium]|nr:S41 family peptidase [Thermoanaerobaculia bacterium]